MLDISNVPIIDGIKIHRCRVGDNKRWFELIDEQIDTRILFREDMFNRYIKALKDVIENKDKYRNIFIHTGGNIYFKLHYVDRSLPTYSYINLYRVPIYIEILKHIDKYNVCLDKDRLLILDLDVLEEVNKRIKKRKRLYKVDNKPYIKV